MKYKLLSIKGQGGVNIGDYIQALASSQFLPQIDVLISTHCMAPLPMNIYNNLIINQKYNSRWAIISLRVL